MDPGIIIENIRRDNLKSKFQNELEYLKNTDNLTLFSNGQDHDIEIRKQHLDILLDNTTTQNLVNNSAKDELFKEIDKYTYRKQWNKLLPFHKIVKIKEYVKENVKDEELQEEIITKMKTYANEGRINTKKYVVYDPNTEKILSFPCLIIDNDKNTYEIKIV